MCTPGKASETDSVDAVQQRPLRRIFGPGDDGEGLVGLEQVCPSIITRTYCIDVLLKSFFSSSSEHTFHPLFHKFEVNGKRKIRVFLKLYK